MSASIAHERSDPQVEMRDYPFKVGEVTRGTPRQRLAVLAQSADRRSIQGLWECTSGEFELAFGYDEFVTILEGEVRVTDGDGRSRLLKTGDVAHFARGSRWAWRVPLYVRKSFVVVTAEPPSSTGSTATTR